MIKIIKLMQSSKLLIVLATLGFFAAGCTLGLNNSSPQGVAGVFKSVDGGQNWFERNLFLHSGGTGSIAGINVLGLRFDPQDTNAIYLNSNNAGLVYSYDTADSWMKAKGLGDSRVEDVAIDPRNKCIIYATLNSTIVKSTDCSRNYSEVYIDPRGENINTAIAIDNFNNLVIYAGNKAGDVLKSDDGGFNWRVIYRTKNEITKILIDPIDTRTVYIATNTKGIFKTTDSGNNWTDLSDGLKKFSGVFEYRNLIFDPITPNSLLYVSKYGLVKTNDGGANWEAITLITPPATTDIYAVAINPKNNSEIYYATRSTFYKSSDNGATWVTTRMPSNALATSLLVDPNNTNIIYMGFVNLSQ